MKGFIKNNIRIIIIVLITGAAHLIFIFTINWERSYKQQKIDNTIFKMVDIKEYIPEEKKKEEIKKEEIVVTKQEKTVEEVIETKKEVKEIEDEYLPQHMISEMPVIPIELLNSRKVYPPLANKQGIEGVVFLELYIDQNGIIRNIVILKDPGYGFGEAAVKALEGIKCIPAKSNGVPVAVKIRYPVRFKLK
jgi:protein TonB